MIPIHVESEDGLRCSTVWVLILAGGCFGARLGGGVCEDVIFTFTLHKKSSFPFS